MNEPPRQIKLQLQEILEAKQISYEQLSYSSGVSEEIIRSYATNPIAEISETIATHLKAIAAALEICVSELFQPLSEEELSAQDLTIDEWSKARFLQLEDVRLVSNMVTIGGGEVFCQLFPNSPKCK